MSLWSRFYGILVFYFIILEINLKQSKSKFNNEPNRKRDAKMDDQDRIDSGSTRATDGEGVLAMSAADDNSKAAFENYPEIS